MLDFSDALRAMKDGKKVRRAVWDISRDDNWQGSYAMIVEVGGRFDPQIVIGYPDHEILRPFTGGQWDLLSEDWEIAE
jgi:hypothetical protein